MHSVGETSNINKNKMQQTVHRKQKLENDGGLGGG